MSWFNKIAVEACPKCGSPMRLRTNSRTGNQFLGCSRFPSCNGTREVARNQTPPQIHQQNQPPIQPQIPQQVQPYKPKPSENWNNKNLRLTWFLATRTDNGTPVAVARDGNQWSWVDENWQSGPFNTANDAEAKSLFKSVFDASGKRYQSQDVHELFNIFHGLESEQVEDTEPKEDNQVKKGSWVPLTPEELKGREKGIISVHHLTQEQRNIAESFGSGENIATAALAGTGKAQPLDSLLLTPGGWIKMGDIKIGDSVFGSDGLPHKVVGVYPQGEKDVVNVRFTDNSVVKCCTEHLWTTETKANRDLCRYHKQPLFSRSSVVKTSEIQNDILYKGYPKHYIPLVSPIVFQKQPVLIDPYVMGVLLGDGYLSDSGTVSYSTADMEMVATVDGCLGDCISHCRGENSYDYAIVRKNGGGKSNGGNHINKSIDKLGLRGKKSQNKFIPHIYKFNDVETRISILQGLMDTDGYNGKNSIEFCSTSLLLTNDVKFIVESLGGTAKVSTRYTNYTYSGVKKQGKLSYRLYIKLPNWVSPFRLSRKLKDYKPSMKYHVKRAIKEIVPIGKKECKCISIDASDNLYVTDNFVLTHNTSEIFHIACSYGRPGEQWQYLVFNKKNKVEAEMKAKKYGIDSFFRADSTNGYLGQVIESRENAGKIPVTKRMVSIGKKAPQKVGLLLDGPDVSKLMNVKYKIPNPDLVDSKRFDRYGRSGSYVKNSVMGVLKQLRFEVRKASKSLIGLSKAYALDPRKGEKHLRDGMNGIAENHDIDFNLSKMKERIANWPDDLAEKSLAELNGILGYNIMDKSIRDEAMDIATTVLNASLPRATNQTYEHRHENGGKESFNLGEMRDFDDDLWFSAINADKLKWPRKKVIMADEAQDFNICQIIALKKLAEAGAQVVIVGDKNQCVIEGTLIKQDGKDVPVESIVVGQNIDAGYGRGKVAKSRVKDVFVKQVKNHPIVKIRTKSGKEISSTPDHTHFCGYTKKSRQMHFVYLMYKENLGYRVGITRSRRAFYRFGGNARLNSERADALWLLGAFDTEREARYYEQLYAIQYGIPTWRFVSDGLLFNSIDTKSAALKILKSKHMFIEYPHLIPKCMNRKRYRNFNIVMCGDARNKSMHRYSISGSGDLPNFDNSYGVIRKAKQGWRCEGVKSQLSEVYDLAEYVVKTLNANVIEKAALGEEVLPYCPASHALPGMSIFVYNNGKVIIDEIESVSIVNYTGKVYDLNVDRVHNFIANDVVTHNSMYRFRGAVDSAIEDMGKILGIKDTKTLSKNFRCRPAIVNFSNENSCVNNLIRGKRLSDKDVAEFFEKANTPENAAYLEEIRKKYPGATDGVDVKRWQEECNEGKQEWPPSAVGTVTNNQLQYGDVISSIKAEKKKTGKLRSTAILSPTNAELLPAALDLLGEGIPFLITGTDLATDLIEHSKSLMVDFKNVGGRWKKEILPPETSVKVFLDKLHRHFDKESSQHGRKAAKEEELKNLGRVTTALDTCVHMYDNNASAGQMPDDIDPNDADAVEAWKAKQPVTVPNAQQSTFGGFLKWLKSQLGGLDIEGDDKDAAKYIEMTEDENNAPVTLSTVHRSKGLEFPVVHILNYKDLIDPPNITREEDLEQWRHAHYVALTRAKDAMHIIREEDKE